MGHFALIPEMSVCTRHLFRRTLKTVKFNLSTRATPEPSSSSLAQQLIAKIKMGGPITVADYMRHVLVNPHAGYYMHRDVLGEKGDFVTSPELSQMFGELLAIWFVNEWSKVGLPKPVQIVELGPGRGTLCYDILRIFERFRLLEPGLTSVHLVEVSPYLTKLQSDLLSPFDVAITWHKHLDEVPNQFSFYLAHEFFDALPVHQFKKTERGYREVLIDLDGPTKFRFVLAPGETVVGRCFVAADESRDFVEVCPDGLGLAEKLATRIESHGGLGLIVDYGHERKGADTFRAFKRHQLHDPLVEPGSADLTADVDFEAIRKVMVDRSDVLVYGPLSQRRFLLNMGIEHRLEKLRCNANDEEIASLDYSYGMLMDSDKMGERFKFMAVVPATLGPILSKYPICGFS